VNRCRVKATYLPFFITFFSLSSLYTNRTISSETSRASPLHLIPRYDSLSSETVSLNNLGIRVFIHTFPVLEASYEVLSGTDYCKERQACDITLSACSQHPIQPSNQLTAFHGTRCEDHAVRGYRTVIDYVKMVICQCQMWG
jgi:hypothetical protein